MHRTDYLRRGFLLTHQRFVIHVDFASRALEGYTELFILPATDTLRHVKINCRQARIVRVQVNDRDAQFKHYDPLTRIVPLNYSQPATKAVHQHPEYKRRLAACTLEGDDGELVVEIPADIAIIPEEGGSTQQSFLQTFKTDVKKYDEPSPIDTTTPTPLPTTPAASTTPIPNYQPIVVRVDFVLSDPDSGVCFVLPDAIAAPHRYPHMFTVSRPFPGGTRLWLPCIDSLGDKCTWEMEYVVQQFADSELDEQHTDGMDENREDNDHDSEPGVDGWKEPEIVVISSGDLVEQTTHPTDSNKKIFHYQCAIPTSAPLIGFAVGSFETISLSQYPDTSTSKKSKHATKDGDLHRTTSPPVSILAFCPPGRSDDVVASCGQFMQKAMNFYSKDLEYGSYPWGSSYKLVFVEDAWDKVITAAGMTVVSTHLLHPDDVVDQVHETRRTLSQALACQWFGSYILPKTWPDFWLTISLAQYAASLFFRKHLGNNEYRYRLKRDIAQCCQLDVNQPPLFNTKFPYPLDSDDSSFVQLKGPLVLFMLNQRMLKGGTSLGISKVIPKFVAAAADVGISTQSFLKTCRKASGVELKSFVDQWIFGAGCPVFHFTYSFNRKKMVVEVNMRQENTNDRGKVAKSEVRDKVNNAMPPTDPSEIQAISGAPSEVPSNGITSLFTGTMTARVHEADGTPYEHVLDIQDRQKKFEVQFNTKYKRIRRNTKRFQARQAAAAAESGDVELGDEMGEHEGDEEKEEWGVVEWGEADEDAASATFEWIRLDSEFEWLCELHFEQPDHMWAFQLARDKDVVAQAEAVEALTRCPSAATSTSLMRTLNDAKCFYRIRMDAAFAMAKCATSHLGWVGLLQLTKTFRRRYGLQGSPDGIDEAMIPRPNDFTNISEYYVQQSIPKAIATVRDDRGRCPRRAQIFILDLLKYNDNSGNPYSDSYYVASLITALGDAFIPSHIGSSGDLLDMDYEVSDADDVGDSLLGLAVREVERYRTLDSLLPSYGNIITSSCLKTLMRYMVAKLVPVDIRLFTAYTRYGHFLNVRLMAFDSLFILNGLQNPLLVVYILNQIAADPSPYVRYHLARNMAEVLGLYVAGGSQSLEMNEMDMIVIEEEGLRTRDKQGSDEEAAKKAAEEGLLKVREKLGKREDLISGVWKLLASETILEHRIQKYLLLFCEILFTPDESGFGFPKLRIRMPLMPVLDVVGNDDRTTKNTNLYGQEIPPLDRTGYDASNIEFDPDIISTVPFSVANAEKPSVTEFPSPRGLVPAQPFAEVSPSNSRLASDTSFTSQPAFSSSQTSPDLSSNIELQRPTHKPKILLKSHQRTPAKESSTNPNPTPSASRSVLKLKVPASSPPPAALPAKSDTTIIRKKQHLNYSASSSVQSSPSTQAPQPEPSTQSIQSSFGLPSTGSLLIPLPTANARQAAAQARLSKSSGTPQSRGTTALSPANSPSASAISFPNEHINKCRKVITKMMKHKSAAPFLEPVDPIKLGIPTYVDIIKNPMDLGTIKRRLDKGQYRSTMDFEDDVRLVLNNCYTFNRPGDWVYNEGQALENVFESEWQDAFGESEGVHMTIVETPSRSASVAPIGGTSTPNHSANGRMQRGGADFEKCKKIIKILLSNPAAFEFLRPVDPIAQGVPTYFDIVQHPMDLGTINTKLRNEEYATPEEFRHDVLMVSSNCKKFNPPGTYVVQQVEIIQDTFEKEWHSQFTGKAKEKTIPCADITKAIPKSTPAAKSVNGSSKSGLKAIEIVLRKLRSHPSHGIFAIPVDRSVPQYYEIVKQPMDLGTIERNLRQGKYRTYHEVESDVCLVFSNCFTFNRPGDPVYSMGKDLQNMWERAYAKAGLGLETAVLLRPVESEQPSSYEGKRVRNEEDDDEQDELRRKKRRKEQEREKKENRKNDPEDRIKNHGNGSSLFSGTPEAMSPKSTPLSVPRKLKIKLKTSAANPGG